MHFVSGTDALRWLARAENFPATEYPADKFRKLMGINVEGCVVVLSSPIWHVLTRVLCAARSTARARPPRT